MITNNSGSHWTITKPTYLLERIKNPWFRPQKLVVAHQDTLISRRVLDLRGRQIHVVKLVLGEVAAQPLYWNTPNRQTEKLCVPDDLGGIYSPVSVLQESKDQPSSHIMLLRLSQICVAEEYDKDASLRMNDHQWLTETLPIPHQDTLHGGHFWCQHFYIHRVASIPFMRSCPPNTQLQHVVCNYWKWTWKSDAWPPFRLSMATWETPVDFVKC